MQIDLNTFDYEGNALIKPPFEQLKNIRDTTRKTTRVVIDSRDRDMSIYPNPASYCIELQDDIEEVTSAELCVAKVNLCAYNISTINNTIVLNNTTYTVTPGDYNATTLLTALNTNAQLDGDGYWVSYDAITDKYTISSNQPFTLESTTTMSKVLGYVTLRAYNAVFNSGTNTYSLTSPYRLNFKENEYIILNIDQLTLNNSVNPILHKSFGIIHKSYLETNYNQNTHKTIKYLNPPIARAHKLKITFRDYYGNLYDFQNQDHVLEIVFESHKHLSRYGGVIPK